MEAGRAVGAIGRDLADHRMLLIVLLGERDAGDLARVGAAIGEHQQTRLDLASRRETKARGVAPERDALRRFTGVEGNAPLGDAALEGVLERGVRDRSP